VPTELTEEATAVAAAAAAVDVPVTVTGLTELPQPDAVTQGLAADGTVYSPAVEAAAASTGPTAQHLYNSKHGVLILRTRLFSLLGGRSHSHGIVSLGQLIMLPATVSSDTVTCFGHAARAMLTFSSVAP
jgi:hypothetical protein